jgi:hypothetical protein
LRTVLKLGVAAAIVVSAYWAIVRVAEAKANALAGGHTFVLDQKSPEEWEAFAALRGRLRGWGESDLAATLFRLQERGDLWVAPDLAGGRSAIYVNALNLVRRVFIRRDELVAHGLPFPDLDVPESAQRTFETIRLAGTLFHELQHYDGLEDEDATYQREIRWYKELRERVPERLGGDERRLFEWAVDSAIKSAAAAREKAEESGLESGRRGQVPNVALPG